MSRGLGQLQRQVLDAHKQSWGNGAKVRELWGIQWEYEKIWHPGQTRGIAEIIYGEATESKLRSIRRAVKRLIEDGYLVKDDRVERERERMDEQRELVARALVELHQETPGCGWSADQINRRLAQNDKDWWKHAPGFRSSGTRVASGYLRAMHKRSGDRLGRFDRTRHGIKKTYYSIRD